MRTKTRAVVGVAVVASAALALTGCGSDGPANPKITTTVRAGVAPQPPQRDGAYFGAWVDPAKQSLGDFEQAMGRTLDIAETYRDWNHHFPTPADTALLGSGRLLLLTLTGGDTQSIVQRRQDKAITGWALAIKGTHKPVFLRWQPDMDTADARHTVRSASSYVAAWKWLRQLFKAAGADNVAWVWCPSAQGFDPTLVTHAADYYPGDDQVDWICTDARPEAKNPADDLSQLLKPFLAWAAGHSRPVMIGEFGVPRGYGTYRAGWLRKAARTLQNPQVKAVLYDDSNAHGDDYSLNGDDAALSAVRELATSPFFNPRNLPVQSN